MMKHEVIELFNIVETGNWSSPTSGRVYSVRGIAPTCNTAQGGGDTQQRCLSMRKCELMGVTTALNHRMEWETVSWRMDRMLRKDSSPALRATDYKCPHNVWYYEES